MNAQPKEGYESLPRAGSYRLLNFEWAALLRAWDIGSAPKNFIVERSEGSWLKICGESARAMVSDYVRR